jgi:hypothetical protein
MSDIASANRPGFFAQLRSGLIGAPSVLLRMSGRSWFWFAVYIGLSGLLLLLCALLIGAREKAIEQALLDFFFPEEWHVVLKFVVSFAFSSQAKEVVSNLVLFLSLTLVSIIFFWAKEFLSQWVERDMQKAGSDEADPEKWRDNALWFEALEEIKWTLLGLALMCITLWIGHDVAAWRQTLASILSYFVLIFSTTVNFIAPPMQRRSMRYNQIIGAIFQRPVESLAFGAVMAIPQIVILHFLNAANLSVGMTLVLLFSVNILFVAWSAAAGTVLGVKLIHEAAERRPFGGFARVGTAVAVLGVLVVFGWLGAKLALALKDKTQILKCRYDVAWSEVEFQKPNLSGLLGGEVEVGVRLPMKVENPTEWLVKLERNRLALVDGDAVIAETRLSELEVPPKGAVETVLDLKAKIRAGSLLEGASLNPAEWGLVLYLDLDGMEFPVPLMSDN